MGDVPVATRGIMFLLTDVLLIPEATENLISVRHATKRGLDFKFSSDRSEIFRKGLKVATARCTDDAIYYLTGQSLIVSPGQGTAMVYVPRLPRLVATAPGCFLLHLCCSPCALVLLSPAALPLPRVIASTCDSVTSTVHWSSPDQCKGHTPQKTVSRPKESPQLWHERYGHLGYENLARLTSMVEGIHVSSEEFQAAGSEGMCESCVLGKQPRSPFKPSTSVAARPLALVHTVLCYSHPHSRPCWAGTGVGWAPPGRNGKEKREKAQAIQTGAVKVLLGGPLCWVGPVTPR